MSYKAVIFDLDGTLLDTLEDLADATNMTLEALGLPTHPVEPYRHFVGDGVENLLRRAMGEAGADDEMVARAMKMQKDNYGHTWDKKSCMYPGIKEMLHELCLKKVRLAIFSNKPDDFTKLCVTQLLPLQAFEIVQGARDGVPRKPNPTGAIEIAGRMGILPNEILYLGDTNTDMKTAKAAGMYAVGVLWGFRDEAELKEAGADEIIATPSEILKFF